MTVYLESSAALAWLLDEPEAPAVIEALGRADAVVASVLTVLETDRALLRAVATGRIAEAEANRRRAELDGAARHWNLVSITADQVDRARRSYPREPVRTLDALHLACALHTQREIPGLSVIGLDHRVRENARALGFPILPP